jgi:hypothetical protein
MIDLALLASVGHVSLCLFLRCVCFPIEDLAPPIPRYTSPLFPSICPSTSCFAVDRLETTPLLDPVSSGHDSVDEIYEVGRQTVACTFLKGRRSNKVVVYSSRRLTIHL